MCPRKDSVFLLISRKDRKHMLENIFSTSSRYGFVSISL